MVSEEGHSLSAVEIYDLLTAFPQERYIERDHYAVTANVFTFRRVIDQIGAFDAQLKSSGDNEWGNRIHRAGFAQVYCQEACVSHPARRTYREIGQKTVRLVHGQRAWRGSGSVRLSSIWADIRPPLGLILRTIFDRRVSGLRGKIDFIAVSYYVRWVRGATRLGIWLSDRRSRPQGASHARTSSLAEAS